MEEELLDEELGQCLDAISRHPRGPSDIRLPPGEVHCYVSPGGRHIYINFVNPSEVPIGSIYLTWVVRFRAGKPESITYYRSRRGASGDDTLPPDE